MFMASNETNVYNHQNKESQKKESSFIPEWITNCIEFKTRISTFDIQNKAYNIEDVLIKNLANINVTTLFPVQHFIIPLIMKSVYFGLGPYNHPPRDLCVSAPTGSGKTLAFALPIVQSLLNRVLPVTRALIVLPTRELAMQVHTVFKQLCVNTELQCVLLVGGNRSIEDEQQKLDTFRLTEADIIVATPGRLVDHLELSDSLNFDYLRFLVIDEADRMMNQMRNNWLNLVEARAFRNRSLPNRKLTVDSITTPSMPLQKLLFSATLSGNAENLDEYNLFYPQLYVVEAQHENLLVSDSRPKTSFQNQLETHEKLKKYDTPALLETRMIVVSERNKPLVVLDVIRSLKTKKVLCFTGSIENANRLSMLIRLFIKHYEFQETFACDKFSSSLTSKRRKAILKRFSEGDINVLISSDSMARGMDIPEVTCVILYDVPRTIETYIHRVGRTARAGKAGQAFTLVSPVEVSGFKAMLKRGGLFIKKKKIASSVFQEFQPIYEKVLSSLGEAVKAKKT